MRTVVYVSPFVAPEWIAAHGLRPCRLFPCAPPGESLFGLTGLCPYVRAFAHACAAGQGADAAVVATTCDQMRRAAELIAAQTSRPVFLLNVPRTLLPAARRLYVDELLRLGRFLVRLGGRSPSQNELVGVMLDYDERRRALRAAGRKASPRQYAEALWAFQDSGWRATDAAVPGPVSDGVPVALLGGPLLREDLALYDLVARCGGWVALDGTETGPRSLPAPLDRRLLRDEPVRALAEAYFGVIPDVFYRPNTVLYHWLEEQLPRSGARGLIVVRRLWCDLWQAEVPRLRQWGRAPVLDLELGEGEPAPGRAAGRVEAFLEMLRCPTARP